MPPSKYQEAFRHLITALKWRKTAYGARESVLAAIKAIRTEKMKQYIENEWLSTLPQWANYAREHSPLLLQVTTTNPVESWHSVLKSKGTTKSELQRFSLEGLIKHILTIDKDYARRAEDIASSFRTRFLPLTAEFEELRVFPFPVQKLLSEEIRTTQYSFNEGEETREFIIQDEEGLSTPPVCECLFFRKWQLPCQHIWHHHIVFGSLTPTVIET